MAQSKHEVFDILLSWCYCVEECSSGYFFLIKIIIQDGGVEVSLAFFFVSCSGKMTKSVLDG